MRRLLFLCLFAPLCSLHAQVINSQVTNPLKSYDHLEAGVTAGTLGIGIDVAYHIDKNWAVRAGFSAMPRITLSKTYSMSSVDGTGSASLSEERLDKLVGYLGEMINSDDVDKYVDMDHEIKFINAKILVDWHPFKHKEWFFTGGLYIGPKSLGKAINTHAESTTMIAINMYNQMYDQIVNLDEWSYPSISLGKYSFTTDPVTGAQLKDRFRTYGRVAVKLGEFDDGTPHYLTPNAEGVMEADAETNVVKPYIGFGYEKCLGREQRWKIGVNAGALFWGKPHVYCSDGVCLIHDVKNVGGAVGNYIGMLKKLPIFPNLELRLSYRIF